MRGKINQKGYKFYVLHIDENGMAHIETGWEYRSDAQDYANEREPLPGHSYKVLTKRFLRTVGIDPEQNNSWTKYTLYKPSNSTQMPTLGKTTVTGRAKKRVRKTASAAKRRINKRIATILKSTTKRLNKIVDSAAKQVKTTATRKAAKKKSVKSTAKRVKRVSKK